MKIMCICLSLTIQRTVSFSDFNIAKVNRSKSFIEDISGKAVNTARVLNQLNNNIAEVISPKGIDNSKIIDLLAKKDKLKLHSIKIPGKTRTCWTLLTDSGITTEVVCDEPLITLNQNQKVSIEKKLLHLIKAKTKNCDAVILAGSTPKLFSTDLCARVSKIVKENNCTLLVDFHGEQLLQTLKFTTPDFIKINEEEFYSTFNKDPEITLENLLKFVSKDYKSTFIITRGTEPAICYYNNQLKEFPVTKVSPVNTTACGDSFNAGFMYSYIKTKDLEISINEGNKIATLNAVSLRPGSII